ncbi:MAG: ABC transporter ATP-binding protein [Actinobacteria bacterium]|nr:ABC transporter ATP-binding protein [Actinomycetota bacterium]
MSKTSQYSAASNGSSTEESESSRLELINLSKEFGQGSERVIAVDNINLSIHPGEFLTLLGPSGCGKTTTLRMIAGFERPSSGEILLDDQDMSKLTPDRRPMGMVFQSYALFPHMSVYENVAFGLKIKKLPAKQIEQEVGFVLATMSLQFLANRAPHQLSGGQQQRVALARAMVTRPKVLLFDEPLSNLDAKLRAQMRIEIRQLQQRLGITSIFVTHDQDEAMSISDRIVVMRNAQIEQVGAPAEIYLHPKGIFVADFVGRSNFLAVDKVHAKKKSGKVAIRVLGKDLEVEAHESALQASAPVLLIRPESIRVSKSKSEATTISGTDGRVLNVVFYGEHVEYSIETEKGNLVAVVSDPKYDEIVPIGQMAEFSFDQERAWLLPADA